jgi:general secretion pathway protein M
MIDLNTQSKWMRPPVLSVAGFVSLVLVLAFWANSYRATSVTLQQQFETKSRLLAGLERQSVLNPAGAAKELGIEVRSDAIAARTGTLAASELQTNLVQIIEEAGGVLHSIQAQVSDEAGGDGLRRLKAQVTFDGSNEALQGVLFKLETGKPYSFVDSLVVQPTQAAGSAKSAWETLRVSLEVSSYWRGDGKAANEMPAPAVR